jgi:hypothetical protein
MTRPALVDQNRQRDRISVPVQFMFLSVAAAYVAGLSVIGGAMLARYMLPVVPLAILVWVSTLWRRIRFWRAVIAVVIATFVLALFVNPPYGFTLEDNLAYRDYIQLHQRAENFIQSRYPFASVLTAWPASDELSHPYLGYVQQHFRVVQIQDFTIEQLLSAADQRNRYDIALVFSTKYVPSHEWIRSARWRALKTRFFGYHEDVPPQAAAEMLGGKLVFDDKRDGQWIGVIEIEKAVDARLTR